MSHQGNEGWFPECISCGAGNVGAVVCLDPTCPEVYGMKPVELKPSIYIHGDLVVDEKLIFENEHWWKCCQICDRRIHADAGAWGSYAMCVGCFNNYINRGEIPPTTLREVEMSRKK
ncbi:MAG: hypothetical protein M3209_10650 [Acidobacteriota bacterium]|nr:hypothetical protein [Acidobacteriota bacterium]